MHRLTVPSVLLVVLLAWGGNGPEGGAQSLDRRLLDRVYRVEAPAFAATMRVADATAFPVFVGGGLGVWAGVWLFRGGEDWTDAYELTVSEAGTLAATIGLKYLVRRTRPYVRFDDVASRGGDPARWDPYSFPSGHASVSFAIATSFSLSHPHWYVVLPVYAWAAGVALSRVWLGVHFPGDVLAGALLGAAVAWIVHRLGPSITPDAFLPDEPAPPPALGLRVILF